jgi:hypothetical protein
MAEPVVTVWGLKARQPEDKDATWIPSLKWSAGKVLMKTILHDAAQLNREGLFWQREECQQFREVLKV